MKVSAGPLIIILWQDPDLQLTSLVDVLHYNNIILKASMKVTRCMEARPLTHIQVLELMMVITSM